jgi:hypothetical protein
MCDVPGCGEKHLLVRCNTFKKLSLQQRLKEIEGCELYWLCYRHLQGRECWSQSRVPNCGVNFARHLIIPYCTAHSCRAAS